MLQQKIFEKIIHQHKSQAAALTKISELLFLNKSNVYRRFTGEIILKSDEIETLVKHYQLSLDEIVHKGKKQFLFTHSSSTNNNESKESYISYYRNIKNQLSYIVEKANDTKSHFLGYEIPIYNFGDFFPEILYFKALQWKGLVWDIEAPFFIDLKQLSDDGRRLIHEACQAYNRLNTFEIWDSNGLDILLEQITYSFKLGQLSYEDAQFLLFATKESINLMEKKAIKGSKLLDNDIKNFELYYSEIPLDDYMFVAYNEDNPVISMVSSTFDTPFIIESTDLFIVKKMHARFQRIKNQAHKISETGELTRRKIFNKYRRRIEETEKKLTN